MNRRVKFLAFFLFLAFVMKAVSEFVHEVVGHGFFVLLFGGRITSVHISLLWPYTLSIIRYASPQGGFQNWQKPWIDGGGILACLIFTFSLQILLFLREIRDHRLSFTLFWLSFWTFINPTGYLIVGGIKPFGDILQLINAGVLTQASSIGLGLVLFLVAFYFFSKFFKDLLSRAGMIKSVEELQVFLSIFWLTIPVTTIMALTGLPFLGPNLLISLPISFIPSMIAYKLPSIQKFISR